MAYNPKRCLWFGTEDYMQWFPTPLQGADSSPEAWGVDGTLLNGGGYGLGSWGSHKTYTYEWPSYSSMEVAQMMKSYADGTYGRGLIYFLDPLTYKYNILPARIADPSMACGDEGGSMVYGADPEQVSTSGWQQNLLPISAAYYDLGAVPSGFRGKEEATFIPIPQGYTLLLGAFYETTGSGGIFVSPRLANGTIGSAVELDAKSPSDSEIVDPSLELSGIPGVYLWLGKSSSDAASVTARALIGRLVANEDLSSPAKMAQVTAGPWIGGMGHSGCRFSGKPTFSSISPLDGGRAEFAASFREVGSWAFG